VPVLPGAEIAAGYLVATQDTAAGGDWFDAFSDSGGHLLLVLGDVVGHGVQAAAVMAQLRTAVRMQLSAGAGITEALEAVDRFSTDVPGAKSATLCVARLDTATGDFEYCTAGHPPPLVIGAEGAGYYLQPTGAGPLTSGRGFATRSSTLAVGDVALLYSDGIIERPGRENGASSVEFAEVTARVLRSEVFPLDSPQPAVQRLCAQAVEILVRATGYSDDITVLAAQRRTPPSPLHVDLPAEVNAERTMRSRLLDWLTMLGADATNIRPLVHAVNEFIANAIEHAYSATSFGRVTLEAALGDNGRVRVTVADAGRWKPPRTGHTNRGRGLPIAHSLIPETVVSPGTAGTTVTVTHRLTRPAHIVTDLRAAAVTPIAAPPITFDMDVSEDGDILVFGDVDTLAAPALAAVISSRSHGGTTPIRIDLSAASHLGSAAVTVLADACVRAERQQSTCTLVAAPGGAAHHVLSLVGLPTVHARISDFTDLPD
jgi:anti-sigma regulatory factor (Ser/Thr protein kinase)/anti-anti-sigma regulatory factor